MKNSTILRQTKDVIRTDGWTTGNTGMLVDGPKCVLGAIAKAAGVAIHTTETWNGTRRFYDMEEAERTPAALALLGCLDYRSSVWSWNDNLGRRWGDDVGERMVLDALDKCAQTEEAAGR